MYEKTIKKYHHELKAVSLGKCYKSRWVVNDVSIKIKNGEIIGLLGPNGAGKTTSFYMVVGLIKPDRGKVILNNEEITNLPIHWRARAGISYLPQEVSVFRKLSVENNILSILEIRKNLNKKKKKRKIRIFAKGI